MAIAWDSIGGNAFILLDGDVDVLKPQLAECTRPGADGRAFKIVGNRSSSFQLRGVVDVANDAVAGSMHATYAALIGSTVVLFLRGVSHPNYLVQDVVVTNRKRVELAIGGTMGGGAQYLVESLWTLTRSGAS